MHHFDGKQISDEQAAELIHKLWMIMSAFVDLGLGIHPAQNKFLPDISVGEDEQRYRLNLTDESKNK